MTAGELFVAYFVNWGWIWGLRSRGELDTPLDPAAQRLRWALFAIAWLFALRTGGSAFKAAVITSFCFAAWPNFAFYIAQFLRALHVLPPPTPEYARTLRIHNGTPTEADLAATEGTPDTGLPHS